MSNNSNLHNAKILKRDEFYTCRSTVEAELHHYKNHFKGKTILCNCDDDEYSEFFKYFQKQFEESNDRWSAGLGLKKLIGVHYESEKGKPSYKLELYKDTNNDGKVTWKDKVIKTPIYGDDKYTAGDFRSNDCIELLKEADIVVTNPPFSLLREFVAQLIEYDKKFLILGNTNAIGYKEIFPLLKENKIWLGFQGGGSETLKYCYEEQDKKLTEGDEGYEKLLNKFGNICFFTNLNTSKRSKRLLLAGNYTPEKYPKYDNYDAINVDKVADIPCDYPGVMGVPLTFMDKYCPEQFEIMGITSGRKEFSKESWPTLRYINPVQHNVDGTLQNGSKVNTRSALVTKNVSGIYYTADNVKYKLKLLYCRILVKNKHPEKTQYREINIKEHVLNKAFDTSIAFKVLQKAA